MAVRNLGYLGIDAQDPDTWRAFALAVGFAEAEPCGDVLRFRMDEQCWRLAIHPAGRDGLAYLGFEVDGPSEFERMVAVLEGVGAEVLLAGDGYAGERAVSDIAVVQDPSGNSVELYYGAASDLRFVAPFGTKFVAGDLGLGHAVIAAAPFEETLKFYTALLGLRVSDEFVTDTTSLCFLRAGRRHHCLALADGGPDGTNPTVARRFDDVVRARSEPGGAAAGLLHFMVEMRQLDEVGCAQDRIIKSGGQITQSLGRHTNDYVVSFYADTPGGFEIEVGCEGRLVDETLWEFASIRSSSVWGHHSANGPKESAPTCT